MSRITLATLTVTALFAAVVVAQQQPAATIKNKLVKMVRILMGET